MTDENYGTTPSGTRVLVIKRGARITGELRDRVGRGLERAYKKGDGMRTIAEACGRSYGFVHRVLTERGVVLRGRGGSGIRRRPRRANEAAAGGTTTLR